MRITIRIVLLALICVLAYLTFNSIAEPVRYQNEVIVKERAVIDKLKMIQECQLTYRDENGEFTDDFDELIDFVLNGQMKTTVEYGSKDDTTTVYRSELVLKNVKETKFPAVSEDKIKNMRYVPFYDTLQFKMMTATIEKNKINVPVFQVTDPKPFSKDRIEENDPLRVGSVYEVDYTGNWKIN